MISSLSPVLFWDTDRSNLEEETHARYIIARVMMYGTFDDWEKIKKHYGLERIKNEMLKEKELDPRSLAFISAITNTPVEQFACYIHKQSVPPTFDLLKKIARAKELSDFRLVGGTALALQIGHRISYDLDFFCFCQMQNERLMEHLSFLQPFIILSQSKNSLALDINGIKVDFVKYAYPFLDGQLVHDSIAMASLKDIAAMKVAAITGRGRRRDFVDLFFLLKTFTLPEILSFYKNKYLDGNELMALRSLNYFEDAENDPAISFLDEKPDWQFIKDTITQHVRKIAG